MVQINYRLDQFEGPLDLLLTLITNNKLNIDDIPIALLCDQYMEYINNAVNDRIEIASEFIVMASELMLIKSKMLLPRQPENGEDPRKPLIDSVIEYSRAKLAASELKTMFAQYGGRMIKEQDDISVDKSYVAEHSVELLTKALVHALTESRISSDIAKHGFDEIVRKPKVSIRAVINTLIERLKSEGTVLLECFFEECNGDYSAMIARFLGFLELIRSHIILVTDDVPADGVTDVTEHAMILLSGEATEERLAEIDDIYDKEDSSQENESLPEILTGGDS